MEDEFELISKSKLRDLKLENKNLKNEIELLKKQPTKKIIEKSAPKKEDSKLSKILEIVTNLSKEKKNIEQNLNDIKELNKKTLNQILNKEDEINDKFENLVENFKELLKTIASFAENNSQTPINKEEENKLNQKLLEKLKTIEEFMNNLKTLLSQVKKVE